MFPTISDNPAVQADYEEMRRNGQSHKMAEMLALKSPPTVHGTDSGFMRGCSGKKWISQLGPKSDPAAWVSSGDDLRAVCKQRGYGCTGLVNVDGPPKPDKPDHEPYRVADDLVSEEVARRCEEDPGLAQRTKPDALREECRAAVSPVAGGM